MTVVLDACAVIAYLHDEDGASLVDAALTDPLSSCVVHAINLYEVYYDLLRRFGEDEADALLWSLIDAGLDTNRDMDDHLRRDAATLKVLFRLSVSDSLGLALARRLGCPFLTADHHELDAIASSGAADTSFIR